MCLQCMFLAQVSCIFLTCVCMCIRYTCMHVPYMCTQRGYVFLTGVCRAYMCYLYVHAACVCTFGDAAQCRNFYRFLLGWWGNVFLLSVLRFSFFIFILPKVMCLAEGHKSVAFSTIGGCPDILFWFEMNKILADRCVEFS